MGFAIDKSEPDTEPLTIAEAKAQCEVDHEDRDDWFTEKVIAARKAIEEATNRVFAECDVVFTTDDFPRLAADFTDGQPALRIPLWPVASVDAVKYRASSGTLTTLVADTDYLVFLKRMPTLIYPAPGAVWPTVQYGRLGAVQVEFTAGVDPKLELAKAAMLLMIGYWWEQRASESSLISQGVPPAAQRIINGLARPMYT